MQRPHHGPQWQRQILPPARPGWPLAVTGASSLLSCCLPSCFSPLMHGVAHLQCAPWLCESCSFAALLSGMMGGGDWEGALFGGLPRTEVFESELDRSVAPGLKKKKKKPFQRLKMVIVAGCSGTDDRRTCRGSPPGTVALLFQGSHCILQQSNARNLEHDNQRPILWAGACA